MSSPWFIFHTRKRTPFYVDLYTPAMTYSTRRVFGFDYHGKPYHINGQVCIKNDGYERSKQLMVKRLKKEPGFLSRFMNLHYREVKNLLSRWKKWGQLPFTDMSNRALVKILQQYTETIRYFWAPGLMPLYGEDFLTQKVTEFVKSRLSEKEADKVLEILLNPKKEGIVGEEQAALYKVALLAKAKQAAALARHAKRFAWMENQVYTHTFYSLAYYQRRLRALKNVKKLLQDYKDRRRQHLLDYAHWLKVLKPDRRMRFYIESLNEAIFYRSWRGEQPYLSQYLVRSLFEEIARRLGVTPQELLFLLPKEIERVLELDPRVKPEDDRIKVRQQGFVYLPIGAGKILTGAAVKKWEQKINSGSSDATELKGAVAFRGLARGVARVILHISELGKVRPGDILITGSTTPTYVPILGKVKAIVTEEGGILSHASMISRELKIPCVIGTKIATKVFKDGDWVEVDADKGTVKKL